MQDQGGPLHHSMSFRVSTGPGNKGNLGEIVGNDHGMNGDPDDLFKGGEFAHPSNSS